MSRLDLVMTMFVVTKDSATRNFGKQIVASINRHQGPQKLVARDTRQKTTV
jgi:hypothetical protein